MDNKLAYISGWLLTTIISMGIYDIVMTALVGLIGGFFGILGKELYYYIKKKIYG